MRQLRLFVAVNFTDKTKNKINSLLNELKVLPIDARWIHQDNLHLTVHFLGNVPQDQLPVLIAALQGAVIGIPPFKLALGGFGAFPNSERPRVFWLGLNSSASMLTNLQRQVQVSLEQIGLYSEKRRFSPHLTLARLRSPSGFSDMLKKAENLAEKESIVASEIINSLDLMSSELSYKGPKYTVITRIRLDKPEQQI